MNEINEIDLKKPQSELLKNKNIIYGAGYNGQLLLNILKNSGIVVSAFYDDDRSRWGELYCGKVILSEQELMENNKNAVCIIISSMYIGQIVKKCKRWGLYTFMQAWKCY